LGQRKSGLLRQVTMSFLYNTILIILLFSVISCPLLLLNF
jgi:hypothetical protein